VGVSGAKASRVIGGKVFRKINSRWLDVRRVPADMDPDGTAIQALSPMPELLWPADDAEYLAVIIDKHLARMIGEAPHCFAGIGTASVQDVLRALAQLRRSKALALAGIEVGDSLVERTTRGAKLKHLAIDPLKLDRLC
jgi:aminocarboxymuconate-semialdehyde decarboxylase